MQDVHREVEPSRCAHDGRMPRVELADDDDAGESGGRRDAHDRPRVPRVAWLLEHEQPGGTCEHLGDVGRRADGDGEARGGEGATAGERAPRARLDRAGRDGQRQVGCDAREQAGELLRLGARDDLDAGTEADRVLERVHALEQHERRVALRASEQRQRAGVERRAQHSPRTSASGVRQVGHRCAATTSGMTGQAPRALSARALITVIMPAASAPAWSPTEKPNVVRCR